ncbi:helix-turn-helix transcriptional regulator [Microbacterium sp. BWR-S6Y]|uniref:helix-turn-helix domain-containing protein n=1 Tax=Microbacterium sp. BWR-S6Y TaxID=3232073 RepID=UPI003529A19C
MLIWASGRTQGAVAEALGIEPTAFGKKLRGKNGWALQEVVDLAAELDTSVAYLFGETGAAPVGPAGIEPTTSTV